jgi:Ca2+-binding RTX toxin-like protein
VTIRTFVADTSTVFDVLADTVKFDSAGIHAAGLELRQLGANLQVGIGGQFMTLLGTSYAALSSSSIVFANGSLFVKGGAGGDKLYGTAGHDFLEGGAGNDSMSGGAGIDTAAAYRSAWRWLAPK